ncbi:MAG TPA: methyltransferase domain-containing protein [Saprospiraceae bacterium]|nr:methyltransferase domain-containing protein [Saprospiraceae bacterium]
MKLDKSFWENQYALQKTGWDIGGVSPQMRTYFEQLTDKNQKILIPGCGNGYEAIWLAQNGFRDVTVIDLAAAPLAHVNKQAPTVKTFQGNFFDLEETFGLIIEQTFFCALDPILRKQYVKKMATLLEPNGILAGLLFDVEFGFDGPPFGGSAAEYMELFKTHFEIITLEKALLSIKPRLGNEVFFKVRPI